MNISDFITEKQEEKANANAEKARKKLAAEWAAVLLAIDAEVSSGREGATLRRVKERTGYSHAKAKQLLDEMIQEGEVEPVEFSITVGNGAAVPTKGWRRPQGDTGNA
jgi:hypothetical protein